MYNYLDEFFTYACGQTIFDQLLTYSTHSVCVCACAHVYLHARYINKIQTVMQCQGSPLVVINLTSLVQDGKNDLLQTKKLFSLYHIRNYLSNKQYKSSRPSTAHPSSLLILSHSLKKSLFQMMPWKESCAMAFSAVPVTGLGLWDLHEWKELSQFDFNQKSGGKAGEKICKDLKCLKRSSLNNTVLVMRQGRKNVVMI